MTTKAVEDVQAGTMDDKDEQAKSASSKAAKTPAKEAPVSPEEEPLIYSQTQGDALFHAGKSEGGRDSVDLRTKLTEAESKVTTLTTNLDDIKSERDKIQGDLEDLSSDDPKKFDLIKRDRDLRQRESDTKGRLSKAETLETNLTEREKKVSSFELQGIVETVAGEYEDGDVKRLKDAIAGFDKPTEEQVRHLAGIIFNDKTTPDEQTKSPKRYSGKSDGGGGTAIYTRAQIADRAFWTEHQEDILKAQAESGQPRIKD